MIIEIAYSLKKATPSNKRKIDIDFQKIKHQECNIKCFVTLIS